MLRSERSEPRSMAKVAEFAAILRDASLRNAPQDEDWIKPALVRALP
jgi:hypothetical protein